MQLTNNYELLNHLMNGCDKKDVTFSKQNNNFIEKLLMKRHI